MKRRCPCDQRLARKGAAVPVVRRAVLSCVFSLDSERSHTNPAPALEPKRRITDSCPLPGGNCG